MRNIKFKAWDKITKQIFEVKEIDFNAIERNIYGYITTNSIFGKSDTELKWRSFDDIKLMQYTGLKDCKGVEIYEGDIVRHTRINNSGKDTSDFYPLKILYKEDIASFVIDYDCCGYHALTKFDASKNVEVIGNIYENPELIGGKNE